jgi:HK97 family phage major capsid protein
VQCPAVTEGDAYLIDNSRIRVLDREQATVMVSTEDRDNFIKNLVTMLGEMRGGFACYDTGAIGKVTLPINSP